MIHFRTLPCAMLCAALLAACAEGDGPTAQEVVAAPSLAAAVQKNFAPTISFLSPVNKASYAQGTAILFSATVRDNEDGNLSGTSLTWTSDRDGFLSNGSSFTRSNLSVGFHVVTLAARDSKGAITERTRTLTITGVVNQAPVASILTPAAGASVVQGTTVSFSGNASDAESGALSGAALQWTSSIAGVIGTGTAFARTDLAVGTHTITLTATDPQGATSTSSRTLTVTAPVVNNGTCANPQPGWIWCDDFETNRLSSYFEYDNNGGDFISTAGVGVGGSQGMRARWQPGESNAGSLKVAFGRTPSTAFRPVDAGTANYREIYWRMYVRNQSGWVGGGGDKLSRAMVFAGSNWSQAAIAHVWSMNTNYLGLDPASGTDLAGGLVTTTYNDFANLRWLGLQAGTTPLFSSASVGQWYCVESHMKLNDAGLSNGVNELWINGTLQAQRTGLNWVGSYNAYGINAVFFENYWNAGSPTTQERYFDNLVVSTARIGC